MIMRVYDISCSKCKNEKETVIGIYYTNGIFHELAGERGLSYSLDHLIYENLQRSIVDTGYGYVRGFTYYGYSYFLVQCDPSNIMKVIHKIKESVFEQDLCTDNLLNWIRYRKEIARKQPTTLERRYFSACLGENPLSKTISQGIKDIPTIGKLQEWRTRYLATNQVVCYITGFNPQRGCSNSKPPYTESTLPVFSSKTITLPTHIPWRQSNMIYSIPFSATADTILAAEACCHILRPMLATEINKLGGRMHSVQICPDYVPEFCIQIQTARGTEQTAAHRISSILSQGKEISQNSVSRACIKINSYYRQLYEDSVTWNRFAGYNAISGSRYDLNSLLNKEIYEQHITSATISHVLYEIQTKYRISLFAASAQ